MKIVRDHAIPKRGDFDWHKRLVIVWQEDDAPVPDKETGTQAWKRLTGRDLSRINPSATVDLGDWEARLEMGWVFICSCEGSSIAVLAKVQSD